MSDIEGLRVTVAGATDPIDELMVRGDLVEALRDAGRLDEALAEAQLALERTQAVGTVAQRHLASLRLADVHRARNEFGAADTLFAQLLTHAEDFGPVVEALTHQNAGQNDYTQGRHPAAKEHFALALRIREELELPEDQIAASRAALAAAQRAEAS